MEDLKINRDKPDLTDEQILKHRNFDSVLDKAITPQLPWYKLGKYWAFGFGTIVILTVIIASLTISTENVESKDNSNKSLIVNSNNLNDTIVAKDEEVLTDENTEVFNMTPEVSIVNTKLNLVIEMPSSVMYNSSGEETNKYQVNVVSKNIPTDIELPPFSNSERFILKLSYKESSVELFGADAILVKNQDIVLLENERGEWKNLERIEYDKAIVSVDSNTSLLAPVMATSQIFSFGEEYGIKEKVKDFEELAGYENIVFQAKKPLPNEWYNKDMWEDVKIEKITKGIYKLELYKLDVIKTCEVEVVFEKSSFEKANQIYLSSFTHKESTNGKKGYFYVLKDGGDYIVLYP